MASSLEGGENLQRVALVPLLNYNLEACLPFFSTLFVPHTFTFRFLFQRL